MKKLNNSLSNFTKLFCASLYVLAAICFMVYTTETLPKASAEDEDLGYDITSANASVTVGTACTFSGSITTPHTSTISNGLSSENIGTTILNTTCNDSGGYAVYAIGYTNEEYGNTSLSYTSLDGNTTNSDYDIVTGTNTSGNTSNWAMKLFTVSGTTTATIESDANGSFSNYHIVPDDYNKVATLSTITDPGTHTSGSSISTTYQAYISPTQAPGTYTGKVKYTLVHPSTAPAPEAPVTIEAAYRKSGAKKTAQGYYKMQDMNPAIRDSVNVDNDSIQVQDIRDNKIYWITKLADGNIWMTQNLDLDIESGRTYTSADTDLANSTIGTSWTPISSTDTSSEWTGSDTTPYSYDPGNVYWSGNFRNDDSGTIYNMTTASGDVHYHMGNYYTWTAALGLNDSAPYYKQYATVNQSICPAGWRLPFSDEISLLAHSGGFTAGINGNIQASPTYFVYGGYWSGQSYGVGNLGAYWSSNAHSSHNAYQEYVRVDGVIGSDPGSRNMGCTLRCLAR